MPLVLSAVHAYSTPPREGVNFTSNLQYQDICRVLHSSNLQLSRQPSDVQKMPVQIFLQFIVGKNKASKQVA